jgi:glycosyltransferase involved in cell wall biosynthesis
LDKILTITVPCYNSQDYMRKCIDSLLPGGNDVEIIIVDDGSSDQTAAIADGYAEQYPDMCRAIHQPNKGHGGAVNTGIRNAQGLYFKVVDSDDWLDRSAYLTALDKLRSFRDEDEKVDIFIANYVYEHVSDGKRRRIGYRNVFPKNRIFNWSQTKHFRIDQNLLMHSVIYRTEVLRRSGLKLPEHTFYVDNLFVYIPLPYTSTLYYMDIDLYRYFIGREDQSVTTANMINRIDQQIRVNKLMIDAYDLPEDVPNRRLSGYMFNYLTMITCITSMLLTISGTEENLEKRRRLWQYFKDTKPPRMYRKVKLSARGWISTQPKSNLTRRVYAIARKIYRFN